MFLSDQLSEKDKEIRNILLIVSVGLLLLILTLWHLQIFSSGKYIQQLEKQVYRTVRVPAVRGEICDRNGVILAASRPAYSLNLYANDLSKAGLFKKEYTRLKKTPLAKSYTRTELSELARYNVACKTIEKLNKIIGTEKVIDPRVFRKHYIQTRALPMIVLEDASSEVVARFMESPEKPIGVGFEIQPFRQYPLNEVAAHLLGFLRRKDVAEEDIFYSYKMPDFVGVVGIEGHFDDKLRGLAGAKSVLINNTGYSQEENQMIISVAGQNVVLTIDSRIQIAAERALNAVAQDVKGAVVVMDVNNGDILALVSAPSYNPNLFVPRISVENWKIYNDDEMKPTLCRASYGNYAPGSIFKIIIGLAVLEQGINPDAQMYCEGYYMIGRRRINDTAPAGSYDFRRAFLKSSNAYFIEAGLEAGLTNLLKMGEQFFLGKKTGIPTNQEVSGFFPTTGYIEKQKRRGDAWGSGHTANLCIGQGDLSVTPLQMAVMTSAIANGGIVYWPRLVDRLETSDPLNKQAGVRYLSGKMRGRLDVNPANLKVIQDAMLADVEDPEGTGSKAKVDGFRVCGKTGTAEVKRGNTLVRKDTWFVSYAPYEEPQYAVVVLVEGGSSGGKTCAPVAGKIYKEIKKVLENTSRDNLRPIIGF